MKYKKLMACVAVILSANCFVYANPNTRPPAQTMQPSSTRPPAQTMQPSSTKPPAQTMQPSSTKPPAQTMQPSSTKPPAQTMQPSSTKPPAQTMQPSSTKPPAQNQQQGNSFAELYHRAGLDNPQIVIRALESLGISTDDLKTAISEGKKIINVLQERKITVEQFQKALGKQYEIQIKQAVKEKKITKEEAKKLNQLLKERMMRWKAPKKK